VACLDTCAATGYVEVYLHEVFTVNHKQRAPSAQQCVPSGVQSFQIHKMSARLK